MMVTLTPPTVMTITMDLAFTDCVRITKDARFTFTYVSLLWLLTLKEPDAWTPFTTMSVYFNWSAV
jgi:hypothetical protein